MFVAPGDPRYPALLGSAASPPGLHMRGEITASDALAIAVVGARRASAYGLEVAERLAFDLAARGVTIVSGLARGIDTAAHRGALAAGGRTIAVLGCGIDIVYPPENGRLMRQIETQGAVVSQFAAGTRPLAYNFPTRNRTLAGLALGVVVVEAGERSGALVTAGYAGDLGREVYAVPGRITAEESRGAHALLRDGAILVRNWADVVQELPDMWRSAIHAPEHRGIEIGRPTIESEEGRVLALLRPDEPLHIEALITRAELSPARAAAALVGLELGGWARQLEGQRWVAAATRGVST
ncbi:MAG: DNA-protecting protein DprA [Candidatus Rokuibacteriota bacterium]|nr:MAG: DNA-protecting protein DprA [Candidatus Rokubacteria bacterium]